MMTLPLLGVGLFGLFVISLSSRAILVADDEDLEAAGAAAAVRLQNDEPRVRGAAVTGTVVALGLIVIGSLGLASTLPASAAGWMAVVALLVAMPATWFVDDLARSLADRHSLVLAPYATRPVRWIRPFSFLPTRFFEAVLPGEEPETLSREEIVKILDEDNAPGEIDDDERDFVQRVLQLSESSIEDCMTPLVEVIAIPEETEVTAAIRTAIDNGHSRLPIYRDRVDNIVGLVDHRDLLYGDSGARVSGLMNKVSFLPESKAVADALRDMRLGGDHFAVVVDEYGGSVGIVTIEDLIEEMVGEIRDERDTDEPEIRKIGTNKWRVPARTEIEELEDALGRDLPDGDYETVAGLILDAIGRIPRTGEVVRVGRLSFRIEAANERSIQLVTVTVGSNPL